MLQYRMENKVFYLFLFLCGMRENHAVIPSGTKPCQFRQLNKVFSFSKSLKIKKKSSSLFCHAFQEEFDSQVVRRGMISALDAAIGKIVTTLKTTGQYNNTVIVFSSDSGSGNLNQMEPQNFEPTRAIQNPVSFKTIGAIE
jgi:hypothetical protein